MATRPITWQNIEASRDGGAASLLVSAQDTINKSIEGGIKAIEDYQKKQVDLNTNQFMDSLYAITDVEVLQQSIESGEMAKTFAQYGSNIDSTVARGAAEKRLTELMGIADISNKYFDGQEERAARPMIDEVNKLVASGNYNEANALASTIPNRGGSVMLDILKQQQANESHELNKQSTLLGMSATRQNMALSASREERAIRSEARAEARADAELKLKTDKHQKLINYENASNAYVSALKEANDINEQATIGIKNVLQTAFGLDFNDVFHEDGNLKNSFINGDNSKELINDMKLMGESLRDKIIKTEDIVKEFSETLPTLGYTQEETYTILNSPANIFQGNREVPEWVKAKDSPLSTNTIKELERTISVSADFDKDVVDFDNSSTHFNKMVKSTQDLLGKDKTMVNNFIEDLRKLVNTGTDRMINIDGLPPIPLALTPEIVANMYREYDGSFFTFGFTSSPDKLKKIFVDVVSKDNALLNSMINHMGAKQAKIRLAKIAKEQNK